jgi:hypothetical protein
VVGFYDRYLEGSPEGEARLRRSEVAGLTTLQVEA